MNVYGKYGPRVYMFWCISLFTTKKWVTELILKPIDDQKPETLLKCSFCYLKQMQYMLCKHHISKQKFSTERGVMMRTNLHEQFLT